MTADREAVTRELLRVIPCEVFNAPAMCLWSCEERTCDSCQKVAKLTAVLASLPDLEGLDANPSVRPSDVSDGLPDTPTTDAPVDDGLVEKIAAEARDVATRLKEQAEKATSAAWFHGDALVNPGGVYPMRTHKRDVLAAARLLDALTALVVARPRQAEVDAARQHAHAQGWDEGYEYRSEGLIPGRNAIGPKDNPYRAARGETTGGGA